MATCDPFTHFPFCTWTYHWPAASWLLHCCCWIRAAFGPPGPGPPGCAGVAGCGGAPPGCGRVCACGRRRWRWMLLVVVVPSARRGRDRDHQPQRVVLLRAICRRHHHRNRSRRAITRWRLRRIALRRRRRRRIALRRRRGRCIHRRWRRHWNRRCRHWRHRWRGSRRYCRHDRFRTSGRNAHFLPRARHTCCKMLPYSLSLEYRSLFPASCPPSATCSARDGTCRPLLSFARCATNSANFAVSTRSLRRCHAHNAALHLRHGLLDRPHRKCWER